jgi:hypothetical protein
MLKHIALAFLLAGLGFAQEVQLYETGKVKCAGGVPKDFACARLVDVDPLSLDGIDIASVVGGESTFIRTPPVPVIREVALVLNGTLYTAVYDPPLKRDDTFSGLGRNMGIPARVDGDSLFVKWPDGKEAKAKIIRREKLMPLQRGGGPFLPRGCERRLLSPDGCGQPPTSSRL